MISVCSNFFMGRPALESPMALFGIFWLTEWLLTIPHELGHAVTARLFGFENVRILLGYGAPVWSKEALGFPWVIHRFPFGGMTLFGNSPRYTQARYILVVLAGPFVSLAAMILILIFCFTADVSPNLKTFPGIFFWANAFVLLQSILPYHFEYGSARYANDGMLVLKTLFPMRFSDRPKPAESVARIGKALQIFSFILAAIAAISLAVLAFFVFVKMEPEVGGFVPILIGIFLTGSSLYTANSARRLIREPLILDSPKVMESPIQMGFKEMAKASKAANNARHPIYSEAFNNADDAEKVRFVEKALEKSPDDRWLIYVKAYYLSKAGESASAIKALAIDESHFSLNVRTALIAARIHICAEGGLWNDAISLCEKRYSSDLPASHKVQVIDAFASYSLYEGQLDHLDLLELWLKRALELEPQNESIKAVLGGVYVEQGRHDEALPLLLPRLESAPHQEQKAFALFYLCQIRNAQRKFADARKLFDQTMILSDADWLKARAAKLRIGE